MERTGLNYRESLIKLTNSEMKEWRYSVQGYVNEIERLKAYNPNKAETLKIKLETLVMKSRISRLDMIKSQINVEIGIKTLKDEGVITKGFEKVFNNSFNRIQGDFKINGKLDKDIVNQIMKNPYKRENFSDNLWGDKREKLMQLLNKHVKEGFIQGVNVQKLTKLIRDDMGGNYKAIQKVVRTELNYALGQASLTAYKQDGIKQYEYLAELDNRTCDICSPLNGEKFNIDQAIPGINYNPMHPNCRCTTVPVVDKSWMYEL